MCALAQKTLYLLGLPHAELSLEIVGNTRMQTLNRQFRGQNRPTDVLAFSQWEGPGPRTNLLGDVVLSLPMAKAQAAHQGHSIDEELIVLMTHGILHLVGYDHERGEKDARRMHRKEAAILRQLRPFPKLFQLKKG